MKPLLHLKIEILPVSITYPTYHKRYHCVYNRINIKDNLYITISVSFTWNFNIDIFINRKRHFLFMKHLFIYAGVWVWYQLDDQLNYFQWDGCVSQSHEYLNVHQM